VDHPADDAPAHLLLVDDDQDHLDTLAMLLHAPDRRFLRAASGEEALQIAVGTPPDLAIVDVQMPGIDGFDTVARLRALPGADHLPVLLVTGANEAQGDILRGCEVGAIDFLYKPYVPALMRHKVDLLLGMQRQRRQLLHEIALREAAVAEARKLAEQARDATDAKSRFLANMSHEIRTPLHAVIGMTSLLTEGELSPAQRERADIIAMAGQGLLNVVNDILDFSKIEAGHLRIEHIPFDLRSAIEAIGDLLAFRAQDKGLDFAILVRHDVPRWIVGDPARLRQILLNLGGNAVKFTDHGEVIIEVDFRQPGGAAAPRLRFRVRDTGEGIPADRLQGIFESFVQAEPATARRRGGTGLGLAIARQLARAMGGDISAESQPGRGSTFTLDLPAEIAPAPESPQIPAGPPPGLRVLVVDPHPASRAVFHEQLLALGCLPRAVAGPQEADWGAHDAVLVSDAATPPDPGRIAAIPCVHVAANPGRGDAARVASAGFAAYLVKPVKLEQLAGALALLCPAGARPAQRDPGAPLVTQHLLREQAPARPRILLVEDNPVNQRVAVQMFEALGCAVDIAPDAESGLRAVASYPYRIAFIDYHMPGMNGAEMIKCIRAGTAGDSRLRTVAMTASTAPETLAELREAGADAFVCKPVALDTLRETLAAQLNDPGNPPMNPTPGAPLDLARLRDTSQGDHDFEAELLAVYLEDCARRIASLSAALAAGDPEGIHREAHTIKGASLNVGTTRLHTIAAQLESMRENPDLPKAHQLLDQLREEFTRIETFAAEYLNRPNH
jgi:signal transduction histidine kinase/HPt (histidine-containing phosphotransfer) domain-containing protein